MTPYQRQKGKRCSSEVVPFGEKVWFRRLRGSNDKKISMSSQWEEGVWLGHARGSNEVLVGNKLGVTKAWAVRRGMRGERWCNKSVTNLRGVPSDWKKDVDTEDQAEEILEAELGAENLVIGGKSMGGRMASLIADEAGVAGLVCLGYPFHPPGRPEKTRTAHLESLRTPALIVQGTRDTLGNREDVGRYTLSDAIGLTWLEDGDHSFKPRKASGLTEAENWAAGIAAVADFMAARAASGG